MSTPEFILKLREKIGHDLLWLVGVTAYVEDGEGRVLLGRRADTREWALVYGINAPGEEPATTVIREVKEETGVDCIPLALARVKASGHETRYANGDRCMFLDLLFVCGVDTTGNLHPYVGDDESLDVGWFMPTDLPQPLAASTVERLRAVESWRSSGSPAAVFSTGQ